MLIFCKKYPDIRKIKGVLLLEAIFSETTYVFVLTYQISSLVLTSFRMAESLLPTSKPSPKSAP